jgi:hypothetical protein
VRDDHCHRVLPGAASRIEEADIRGAVFGLERLFEAIRHPHGFERFER